MYLLEVSNYLRIYDQLSVTIAKFDYQIVIASQWYIIIYFYWNIFSE